MAIRTRTSSQSVIKSTAPTEEDRVLIPAGRAVVIMLLSFGLASLLGAASLHHLAQRQPDGPTRDIALDITGPLARVSHTLWLDRPRQWLASVTHHEDLPSGPPVLGALMARGPP